MVGRMSMWGSGEFLSSFFGKSATPPDTFYVALIKEIAPTSYVSGAELDEPKFESYARVGIPNNGAFWTNDSQPQVMLTEEDTVWTQATEDWGVIRYWALCNAPLDGMTYATGALASPYTVNSGDAVILGAGDLSISLGPFYSEES